jgi:hypothetical protein
LDPLTFVSDHAAPLWAAVAAGISGLGAWLINMRHIKSTVEQTRISMSAEVANAEVAERAAFRTSLMSEISEMRRIIKECEVDKETLRQRLNTTEGQILVLKASNEIMERWVAFFNERGSSPDRIPRPEASSDGSE